MKWSLKQLSTVLAYVALLPSVYAAGENSAVAPEDSSVVKLTSETFEKFIQENPLVLLEFFAPWCGHCKNLGPEFASAADDLVAKDIKLAQVDCTEEHDLCQDFGIQGYPTLKVFKGESTVSDYKGGRTQEDIVSYMIKQSLPPVSEIKSEEELDSLLEEAPVVVVQIGGADKNNQTFYDVAGLLNEKYSFVSVEKPIGKFASSKAKYLILRNGDEVSELKDKEITADSLNEFIAVESKPLFGFIDGSTFEEYMSAKLPLAYYFHETPEERELVEDLITKLAKQYRGKINFVSIDASKYGRHAANLNMEEEFPMFAIHDIESNLKYGLPTSAKLNKEIESFVKKFSKGKAEPIVKSEAVPTKEELAEQAVYKLVGKTHDDVIKSGKKVLVKYYAPWCGHCKKLAPTYEELLSIIAKDEKEKDNIIIANIDGTLNDVNVELTGYPTLILYEGDKEPVVFKGPRDLETLADFVGFDLNKSMEVEEVEEDDLRDEL